VQGGKVQEYEYISSVANATMPVLSSAAGGGEGDKIGQIPKGRQNGFYLEAKCLYR
jgi:hypothetical protein